MDGQRINIRAVLVVGANRYSRNNEGSRSCASCHNPGLSWADGQPRAVGLTQELLTLRCPTLLGVAWIPRPGWTGRFRDLESVAMTPITSPLRVKSRHAALKRRCPLYPQKRTFTGVSGMSALCGGLNRSTQHYLGLKRSVYSEGSAISSRFHSGREGGAVKSLAERGSRSNDRMGV